MKRISSLSITLFFVTVIPAQALENYHIPLQYRTHWSPYSQSLVSGFVEYNPNALTPKSNGLVSYRLEYSPYALSYKSSGFIDRDVEYNPYAFGVNSSGLVSKTSGEIYCGGTVLNIVQRETCTCQPGNICGKNTFTDYSGKTSKQVFSERKAAIDEQKVVLEKIKEQKANDPSEAIREYLDSQNIRFNANRSLRIEGETVSINFNIEDANIIIKFWNSKAITELSENKYKKDIFDNYLKSWKEYCLNNIGDTKKIYNIFSDSKEDLLKQLSFDDNLNSDDILYASSTKYNE